MASDRTRSNNIWFVVFFVLMVAGGLCAIGYWQSYTLTCSSGFRVWSWTTFPPKYVCSLG